MLNGEKFKDEIARNDYQFALKLGGQFDICVSDTPCGECKFSNGVCSREKTKWLLQEYKEPILNPKEEKYLGMLIKPFRDRVMTIKKSKPYEHKAFIMIEVKTNNQYPETIVLPSFDARSGMYERMMNNKRYKLEDLGL